MRFSFAFFHFIWIRRHFKWIHKKTQRCQTIEMQWKKSEFLFPIHTFIEWLNFVGKKFSFELLQCFQIQCNMHGNLHFEIRFSVSISQRERKARIPYRPLSCFHQVDFQTYLMGKIWMQSSCQYTLRIRSQSLAVHVHNAQRVRTLIWCSFF